MKTAIATAIGVTALLTSCVSPREVQVSAMAAVPPGAGHVFVVAGKTNSEATMYAGPDTKFPSVTLLAADLEVTIYGCLGSWQWCDVDWRGDRGWIRSDLLIYRDDEKEMSIAAARKRIPVLKFSRKTYWYAHYRDRLWYDSAP